MCLPQNHSQPPPKKATMKTKLTTTVYALLLAGCATPSTVFVTPLGTTIRCEAHGAGYVGAPMAQKIHDKCVSDVQVSGALPISEAGGIGVLPSAEEKVVKVLRVSRNSPAEKAGMKGGVLILAVDGQTVKNWTDARRLLFGRIGTDVTVTFSDGASETTVTMTRSSTAANTSAQN